MEKMLNREILHSFAAHPLKWGDVSRYMTEATRKEGWAVTLGPYTYIPAPAHSSATVNGTLTKGGCPVALQVTEPVLRDFIDTMSVLEKDLARRWISATDWPAFVLAE